MKKFVLYWNKQTVNLPELLKKNKSTDFYSYFSLLFLTDLFLTDYMAAENCHIKPGDIVAIWGCGLVGQFAISDRYDLKTKQQSHKKGVWVSTQTPFD